MNSRWREASCWLQRSLINSSAFLGRKQTNSCSKCEPKATLIHLFFANVILCPEGVTTVWREIVNSCFIFTFACFYLWRMLYLCQGPKEILFTLSDHSSFRPPPSVKCMIPVPHTVLCNAESSDVSLHLESGRQNSFIKSEKRVALGIRQSAVVWQSSGAAL